MNLNLTKEVVLYTIKAGLEFPASLVDRYYELHLLKKLLTLLEIDCVLDVGANRGQFAHELRKIGYTGPIVSFEPVQREFYAMSESFEGDPNWKGYQLALGAEDRLAYIHVIPALTVMSSLLTPRHTLSRWQEDIEEIQVKRLDDIFHDICRSLHGLPVAPRVFLKMDTQGYDLQVFKGAERCADFIVGLQSELSIQPLYENMPHYLEALNTYEHSGFEVYNLSVVSRTASGGLQEVNCFMKRRDIR